MAKNKKKNEKPHVNPQIEPFDITINEFGEIKSSLDTEKVNDFLNKNLIDKKLKDHPNHKDKNAG